MYYNFGRKYPKMDNVSGIADYMHTYFGVLNFPKNNEKI